jgi:hypothetical protein
MNVHLMTDLEAVAGVIDPLNRCYPEGRYFEAANKWQSRDKNSDQS